MSNLKIPTTIKWFSYGPTRALNDDYVKSERVGQDVISCYTSYLVINFIYFSLMIYPDLDLILITYCYWVEALIFQNFN